MPQHKIILNPGINYQETLTLNSTGWGRSNLIRYKSGLLQKLGGWTHLNTEPIVGVCRSIHGFEDLSGNAYIGIGTNERLELYWTNNIYDITPIRATTNPGSAFTTTASSADVSVNDTGNGANAGDWINIQTQVSIGGIVLFGFYKIQSITDADNYVITASSPATSSVSSGGDTPLYTTLNTSTTITVTFNNHGYSVGSVFDALVSTTVATVIISGEYLAVTIPDANTFTITAASAANASTSGSENSGNARIQYLLASGPVSSSPNTGYGAGTYGTGYYGIGGAGTGVTPLRIWALDNFGENLLGVPTNGALYQWIPPVSVGNVATIVTDAPSISTDMFVAMPQRQVVLLGTYDPVTSAQDPLLVRFSDVGSYTNSTDWIASTTNQAGSFRLSRGSAIIGGCQSPQTALIWTDTDLWMMQYIQPPLVYGFSIIGSGCGLISQNAWGQLGRNTFWMSNKGFFVFGDSGVQQIPCPVWDKVFADLDTANADKCVAASNSLFNEMAFYYPSKSGGTGEIDAYVKVNVQEGYWDYGNLIRTAWMDSSPFGEPIGVDDQGILQQHETSADADGDAMLGVMAETGYADIVDGTLFMFVDQIIPDIYMTGSNPSVTLTIYATDYPGATPIALGPYTVTSTTTYIAVRVRARQLAFKIESDSLGTFWRWGAPRYRGAPAGRR